MAPDHNVEGQSVNRCQNNTRVNDANGRNVFDKGKHIFTDCVSSKNPVPFELISYLRDGRFPP